MSSLTELRPKPSLQFTSSAFYDHKTHPSLEDQVVLCRQIARQLVCDESNAKSKGREMFEKRVQKSSKWVTTADDTTTDDDRIAEEYHEHTISDGPPNLKLVLDPRHVQDLSSLDFESNETESLRHDRRSKSQSRDIVSDLTSPDIHPNRGNVLFAKRQQKSSEWIVESVVDVVDVVHQKADEKLTREAPPPPPTPIMPITHKLSPREPLVGARGAYRDFNARARPFTRSYL